MALNPFVITGVLLVLLQNFQPSWSELERPSPNALFDGDKVNDFYDYCTHKSKIPCHLSTPEDFDRLQTQKKYMKDLTIFYRSGWRLYTLLGLQAVIMVLMIHLTLVRHFDWRSLPLINLGFDQQYQDKTHGVTFQQYIWMRYQVLRGTHPCFHARDHRDINWYKYKDEAKDFDYKSVHIQRFTFLEKKLLASVAKHLEAEADKDEKEKEDDETHKPNPKEERNMN